MENFAQVGSSNNNATISDEADRRLLHSLSTRRIELILRVKRDDPEVTRLVFKGPCYWHESGWSIDSMGWRRVGSILGQNSKVVKLSISCCNPSNSNVHRLFAGFQSNRHIRDFEMRNVDLQGTEKLQSLAPFLRSNPSLRTIRLSYCSIGPDEFNAITNALSARSDLKHVDLNGIDFGDDGLDDLVLLVERNKDMNCLTLNNNRIGSRGCTSLARLLRNNGESNLTTLDVNYNDTDDECAIILAKSLAKNTKLQRLWLHDNSYITGPGWSAFLRLVFNPSSLDTVIKSNHTICRLIYSVVSCDSDPFDHWQFKEIASPLGYDNANLLRASLKLNEEEQNKTLIARRKILWGHVRDDLNLGGSSIPTGAMSCILAWIGDDSNETNANLIQYHDPPLSQATMNTIRLNAIYRILRSRPALMPCVLGSAITNPDTSHNGRRGAKRKANELGDSWWDLLSNPVKKLGNLVYEQMRAP